MRNRVAIGSVLSAGASLVVSLSMAAGVEIDRPAPDFTLKDTKGGEVSLSAHKGKTVVLEWLNHDCPFVKKHYDSGNMPALQKSAVERGVVWLSVSSSAPGKQGHYTGEEADRLSEEKASAATAVLLDPQGTVGRLYGAKTTPHMFVIDPQGVLRYAGAIDSIPTADRADVAKADNHVAAALESVLGGKPVETKVTQPYGCSVKY
jgi:peroxiredoxin